MTDWTNWRELFPHWRRPELDTHELAWAAGFFDGEGCSGCYRIVKTQNVKLYVQVAQSEPYQLERFKRAVKGLGAVYPEKHRKMFRFSCANFEKSQAIIAMLWKYLSPTKRNQFKIAMMSYHQLYDHEMAERTRLQRVNQLRLARIK